MDEKTIDSYNKGASVITERHLKVAPERLYDLAKTFFYRNHPTLDLGCGSGRDTHWLNQNSFPAEGIDASERMLEEAKKRFEYQFSIQALPNLKIPDNQYSNIFCSAVLMHIPTSELVNSIVSLLRILKPEGRAIVSWRDGNNENDGRLFQAYNINEVAQLFESLGGKVVFQEIESTWKTLVIEKTDSTKREGIKQIQDIITRDKKTATYKFALLRALCEISRYETHVVTWDQEASWVYVPMKRIAIRWVHYYWPLVKSSVRQTTSEKMAFEDELKNIHYDLSDIAILKNDLEDLNNKTIQELLKKISNTIQKGPVTFAGGGNSPVFSFIGKTDASVYQQLKEKDFGAVAIPISMWRDINLFSHWIEDSLSIQWAELTEKINHDKKFAEYFDLITRSIQENERSTYIVRKLLQNRKNQCVWSGRELDQFAVDHMIPWSVWRNNDLWNLLPADPKINNQKRDFLPTPTLIKKSFNNIKIYWELYNEAYSDLFQKQLYRSLGIKSTDAFTNIGAEALEHSIIRINETQSGIFWDY